MAARKLHRMSWGELVRLAKNAGSLSAQYAEDNPELSHQCLQVARTFEVEIERRQLCWHRWHKAVGIPKPYPKAYSPIRLIDHE